MRGGCVDLESNVPKLVADTEFLKPGVSALLLLDEAGKLRHGTLAEAMDNVGVHFTVRREL